MEINQERLEIALGLLDELFVVRERSPEHFVVCGGSSLLALGLVKRTTTKDVDSLARLEDGQLEFLLALDGLLKHLGHGNLVDRL